MVFKCRLVFFCAFLSLFDVILQLRIGPMKLKQSQLNENPAHIRKLIKRLCTARRKVWFGSVVFPLGAKHTLTANLLNLIIPLGEGLGNVVSYA